MDAMFAKRCVGRLPLSSFYLFSMIRVSNDYRSDIAGDPVCLDTKQTRNFGVAGIMPNSFFFK